MSKHEGYMQKAIDSAREGVLNKHGGPFGACIVKNDEVIAVGHNTVLRDHDPTCHAEMNAIRGACQHLGSHLLSGCTLYTTAEPCPMCLAGALWARIDHVVVGAERSCAAKHGFDDAFFYEEIALPPKQRAISSEYGILGDSCEALFLEWNDQKGELY